MKRAGGCQSIFSLSGEELFAGEWNPQAIVEHLPPPGYWKGRRVLDLGANTSGLSIELARMGASVVAAEPDPYRNTRAAAYETLTQVISTENLEIEIVSKELFECFDMRGFDTVMCLGLLYHFREPQGILDRLNLVTSGDLIVSTQTAPGDELILVNRRQEGVLRAGHLGDDLILTGWHATRPLFERMLQWAGFHLVRPLTDKAFNFPNKPRGLTNSAYYIATKAMDIDFEKEVRRFYPR